MSDLMLHAVLKMPPDCWTNEDIDIAQRYSFYLRASNELNEKDAQIEKLQQTIDALQSTLDCIADVAIRSSIQLRGDNK